MRILVTGGAGFIGTNLLHLLSGHGHELTVLDNLSTGRRKNLASPRVKLNDGDIADQVQAREVAHGMDKIVHPAARIGTPGSLANPPR